MNGQNKKGWNLARVFGKQGHVMICMESWVAVKDEAKMMLVTNKKGGTIQSLGQEIVQLFISGDAKQTQAHSGSASAPFPFLCNLFILNERRVRPLSGWLKPRTLFCHLSL